MERLSVPKKITPKSSFPDYKIDRSNNIHILACCENIEEEEPQQQDFEDLEDDDEVCLDFGEALNYSEVAGLMRTYVQRMPDDAIFTSRDLLPFASRTAVDSFTSRSVKSGYIERLTRGVFRKLPWNRVLPPLTDEAIVQIKRAGFAGASLLQTPPRPHYCENADHLRTHRKELEQTIYTDGRTSALVIERTKQKVKLSGIARRKFALGSSALGRGLLAIWKAGRKKCTRKVLECFLLQFNYRELLKLTDYRRILPQWLSERINFRPAQPLVDKIKGL
ncbi:MAG: hypothetical protein K2Y32_06735 [Candidatus Obscuribacterales bacterium]|nr:hypothetical protein [Candidatus Obscuribacterales bacterium]